MTGAAVITCSNRSAAGERADDSGQLIATTLRDWGYDIIAQLVVPDEISQIQKAFRHVHNDGARLIISTGGTGLTPTELAVSSELAGPL